jgi:hypothetical protein
MSEMRSKNNKREKKELGRNYETVASSHRLHEMEIVSSHNFT